MIPRSLNSLAAEGSDRTELMTEPPWLPVAPNTTKTFLSDMSVEGLGQLDGEDMGSYQDQLTL